MTEDIVTFDAPGGVWPVTDLLQSVFPLAPLSVTVRHTDAHATSWHIVADTQVPYSLDLMRTVGAAVYDAWRAGYIAGFADAEGLYR